jgi:hypothetical protein
VLLISRSPETTEDILGKEMLVSCANGGHLVLGSKSPIPSLADYRLCVPVRIEYAVALNQGVSLCVVSYSA